MTCVCDASSVSKISARVGIIPLLETSGKHQTPPPPGPGGDRYGPRLLKQYVGMLITALGPAPLSLHRISCFPRAASGGSGSLVGSARRAAPPRKYSMLAPQKTSWILLFLPRRAAAAHCKTRSEYYSPS